MLGINYINLRLLQNLNNLLCVNNCDHTYICENLFQGLLNFLLTNEFIL